MSQPANQTPLRLLPAPRPDTVELLHRTFGDVLIPLETLRARYFRNLNIDTFRKALGERIALPVTQLDPSRKGEEFVEIHHLAAYVEARAYQADELLAREQQPEQE
ncbi:pyocin activator PrtN family protein [Pseudomonas indica]|uniref:Pyocin activator protein PrtN n=1 Tax=Pseudomonas indica TaxID=137658 RepID=A0A1G8V254_9PSED|nr:pyocin activator PrtN family protein [Pseudomonas indica]SDJ60121.1 Pyocin activator protein PrtN [Pseudomonas indica]